MLKARIRAGVLEINEGVPIPIGLSHCQICQRQDHNLFAVHTVYAYQVVMPAYIQQKNIAHEIVTIGSRLRTLVNSVGNINGEVGSIYYSCNAQSISLVFFTENNVFNWATGTAFKKMADFIVREWKAPYYEKYRRERSERKRQRRSSSYVKPSQLT